MHIYVVLIFFVSKLFVLSGLSINLVDFSDIFKNSSDEDFIDHGHYSKIAQDKIGKLIFEEIKEKIKCNK